MPPSGPGCPPARVARARRKAYERVRRTVDANDQNFDRLEAELARMA